MPQATYPSPARATPMDSYLVLLRAGFTMPQTVTSCAVRSYRTLSPLPVPSLSIKESEAIGGLLSAALSVGSRPPGVTWHSALWSPDFPPLLTQYHRWKYRENVAAIAQPTPAARVPWNKRSTTDHCRHTAMSNCPSTLVIY